MTKYLLLSSHRLVVAALFLVMLQLSDARLAIGQTAGSGAINAKVFVAFDRSTPVSIRFQNDTELNVRLLGLLKDDLAAENYNIRDDGVVELVVETEIETAAKSETTFRLTGEGGNRRKRGTSVGGEVTVPLSGKRPIARGPQYRMTFTLARNGKPPMWSGSAKATARRADREAVFAVMAQRLVDAIGKSVTNQRFELN